MRVAEDDHVADVSRERERRSRPPELMAVADMDRDAADDEDAFGGQRRIVRIVHVAVHRVDSSDPAKAVHHCSAADISRVNDAIDAREHRSDLRTQESMCIGDEPDSNHSDF